MIQESYDFYSLNSFENEAVLYQYLFLSKLCCMSEFDRSHHGEGRIMEFQVRVLHNEFIPCIMLTPTHKIMDLCNTMQQFARNQKHQL